MKKVRYHVPAIANEEDKKIIEKELSGLPNVEQVAVDIEKKNVTVCFSYPSSAQSLSLRLTRLHYVADVVTLLVP